MKNTHDQRKRNMKLNHYRVTLGDDAGANPKYLTLMVIPISAENKEDAITRAASHAMKHHSFFSSIVVDVENTKDFAREED